MSSITVNVPGVASLSRLATVDIAEVKGLGGKRSQSLSDAGIRTVADLLHHAPRRYIDRTRQSPIAQVPIGPEVTIIGRVKSVNHRRPRRNLQIIEAVIEKTAIKQSVYRAIEQARRPGAIAPSSW